MLEEMTLFRTILCVCPCCGKIRRLSDLQLHYKGKAPKTWLDDFDSYEIAFQKKEERFDEKESELRQKATVAGRKLAEKAMGKLITPGFKKLGVDTHDVKSILHPVDYVAFMGMTKKETVVDEILFLTGKDKGLSSLRDGIRKVIEKKEYSWQVIRLGKDGKMELE